MFTQNGLEFTIECSFQYLIMKKGLKELYLQYGEAYGSQVINQARSILKDASPSFTVDQYISDRGTVQGTMYGMLKDGLNRLCDPLKIVVCIDIPENKFQLRRIAFPIEIKQNDAAATLGDLERINEFQEIVSQ